MPAMLNVPSVRMPRLAVMVGVALVLPLFSACGSTAADAGGTSADSARTSGTTAAGGAGTPLTDSRAGGQRVVLAVQGMSCESCERTVSAMLRRTPGVLTATVSVARGEAVVTYDPARTTPADLARVVRQLGYEAAPRDG